MAKPKQVDVLIKVHFRLGDDPMNATCASCGHKLSRHGVNAYNNDGNVHCWDCIGCGIVECIHKPTRSKKETAIRGS